MLSLLHVLDNSREFKLQSDASEHSILDVFCFSLPVPSTPVWRRFALSLAPSPTVCGCLSKSKHSARSATWRQRTAITPAAVDESWLYAVMNAPPLGDCSLSNLVPTSKRQRYFWTGSISTGQFITALNSFSRIAVIRNALWFERTICLWIHLLYFVYDDVCLWWAVISLFIHVHMRGHKICIHVFVLVHLYINLYKF